MIYFTYPSKESRRVDLLIAAEAGWIGEDNISLLLTVEYLRDLVGLGRDVDVLEQLRIDGLGDEPGVDQRDLIFGVIGVVVHLQVDLAVLPGLL